MPNVEELIFRIDSGRFSSKDVSLLEDIVSSKKREVNDPQISVILSDAIETMKACGLLLSKIELESTSNAVRIDSEDWRQLGSDTIYYKIDDILRKMHINNNIGTLTHALGGTIFYIVVNRSEYTSFIHKLYC